jgi:tetratricopeptide (TPR) repeat protein
MLLACLFLLQVPPEVADDADASAILSDLLAMIEAAPSPEAGAAAWEEFVAQVDWWRQTATPYDEARFDPPRFQARLAQAQLLERVQPTSLGLMERREALLLTYLEQYRDQEPPEGVSALNDALGAHHALGMLRRDMGAWQRRAGDTDRAHSIWARERERLRAVIEEHTGVNVATAEDRLGPDAPWITNLTALYLELVHLADGPAAYADAAEAAARWLPHDDNHAVVTQMRQVGWNLSLGRDHLEPARRLLALVRDAHRERWNGAYATYADNMGALLAGIRAAIKLGHQDEARALLEEALRLIHDVEPQEVRDYLMGRIAGLLAEFSRQAWLAEAAPERDPPVEQVATGDAGATPGRAPRHAAAPPREPSPPARAAPGHPPAAAEPPRPPARWMVVGAAVAAVATAFLVAALRAARKPGL